MLLDLLDLRAVLGFERRQYIYICVPQANGVVKNNLGSNGGVEASRLEILVA